MASFRLGSSPQRYRNTNAQTSQFRNILAQQPLPRRTARRRRFMSGTTDKIKGTANEAMGKAKQGVGEAVGSDRLQGEGAVQEVKGKGQKALGDAKEATKDAVNRAANAANKNL
jgi:uncharacterized protein YjbJ (UPF0337 family)